MFDVVPPPGRIPIGVDVGGTKMLVVAYTDAGRRVWRFPTGVETGPEVIRGHLSAVLAELGPGIVGFAVPGIIDHDGCIQDCDVLPLLRGWNPTREIPGLLTAAVLNDGEAALASAAAGEPLSATIAAIGSGTGIAAAFQIAGKRLRQHRPYAGELGLAPFGLDGTFDDQGSGASLLRRLGLTAEEIAERMKRGDEHCIRAVEAAGRAFGASLVTVLHLMHPEKIGLYGGTLRFKGYVEAAMGAFQQRSHPLLRASCRVEVMTDTELVVANGALRAALEA